MTLENRKTKHMSKLLKEAIADAKAVRETALANARLALEEAFAPRLQSMLTKKLREEEAELDGVEDEVEVSDEVEEGSYHEDDVEVDEPSAEDEVEEGSYLEDDEAEDEVADVDAEEEAPAEDSVEDEIEVEDEVEDEEEIEEDSFDLDSIIAELESELTTEEEEGEDEESEEEDAIEESSCSEDDEEEAVEEQSDSSEIGKKDNHVDVADCKDCEDPQGSSLTEEEEKESDDAEEAEELDEEIDIEIVEESEESVEESEEEAVEESIEESEEEEDEEINLEEILKELEEETNIEEDESSSEIEELKATNTKLQKENEEYRKVYKYLRGKLNEVNLLNAKLLYTNKLFKQHALTEEQKLKVVESFDLTKNVREAKLVYATLGESFRSSTKETAPVEKPKASSPKKSLTEGMASKPIKSTKPSKKILSEGNDLADRFKKLAGIV